MNVLSTDIIFYISTAASFGMLFAAIKIHRTPLPKLGVKRAIQRDF